MVAVACFGFRDVSTCCHVCMSGGTEQGWGEASGYQSALSAGRESQIGTISRCQRMDGIADAREGWKLYGRTGFEVRC